MTARNRSKAEREGTGSSTLPDQQDEADINAALGGEVDEAGRPVIDEERAREIGAVDAESVRANRRSEDFVRKKRAGIPNITFSSDDLLERYDNALKTWPPNTLEIYVRRLSGGAPVTHVIVSHPTSGTELHRALLQQVHGQNQEAEYEVKALDANGKKYRVNGRIILPETRPPHERGQPMQGIPPGYPPGYPPPVYYPQTQPYMQTVPGQQPLPQQVAQTAPAAQPAAQQQPQPIFFQPPAGPDPMAMLKQTFELVQSIMASQQPQVAPQQPMPFVPPPPATSDPAVMMQYLQQVVELVKHMQPPQPRGTHAPQPQPQTPMQTGPTRPPPPGMMWAWEPSYQSFVLMPAPGSGGSSVGPSGMPARRPPYGFSPQQGGGGPPWQQQQQPYQGQPQRQQSAADNFREGLRMVRELRTVADEFGAMFDNGGGGSGGSTETSASDDNSPVEVLDLGPVKGVFSKEDGSTRWGETILANMGDGFKWLAEQREMFVKEKRAAEEARQRPVLPQGVIEVRPGDQPPPGFAFVPVQVQQAPAPQTHQTSRMSVPSGFPDPPAQVPPPINSEQPTPPPAVPTWTMPEE